ncbi:MAG: flagellar hook-basal body complex protein FliE [Gemmobacter sp.]
MDINTAFAARSYASARPATAPSPEGGPGFAKLAESFVDTLAKGEAAARAAKTGDADPHALVQALAATELAVETAVTLRDKVVEAYQEILRMPV